MQSSIQGDRQKIEIYVSGRSLRNMDYFSKSDPYVSFFMRDVSGQKWAMVGRTETINNDLNPNFKKYFMAEYIFEMKQECRFEVWDDDGGSADLIGYAETTIGKIMNQGAQKQTTIMNLVAPGAKGFLGKLVVRCDVVKECSEYLMMHWVGVKLMNTDGWFGKSDPFLRFNKLRDDGTQQLIQESEVIMDNLNPVWKPIELNVGRISNANPLQPFKIECWDWENSGKFQFIGEVQTTIDEIKKGKKEFILKNPKNKHPGTLRINQMQAIIKPTFLDYVRGGLQLNLLLAVDFTGSNGVPSQPSSLHYMDPSRLNQYQQAILSVGDILLAYDYDQRVPCYGFGAKTRYPTLTTSQVLHCFPLSGVPEAPEALGIQQILEQYNYALHHVELSGPTFFGPIVQQAMIVAQTIKQEEQNAYVVLLILTDGEIHDMQVTIDYIVNSSHLPLSLIIVGIGQADFSNMEILDGDSGLKNNKGQSALRDLVQFVPFRQFNGNPALLARHVLAEVPQQVVTYHQLVGKKPNPPVIVDTQQMGYTQVPKAPLSQTQGGYPQGANVQPPQSNYPPALNTQGYNQQYSMLPEPQHPQIYHQGGQGQPYGQPYPGNIGNPMAEGPPQSHYQYQGPHP